MFIKTLEAAELQQLAYIWMNKSCSEQSLSLVFRTQLAARYSKAARNDGDIKQKAAVPSTAALKPFAVYKPTRALRGFVFDRATVWFGLWRGNRFACQ
jgi:hypothetical protein